MQALRVLVTPIKLPHFCFQKHYNRDRQFLQALSQRDAPRLRQTADGARLPVPGSALRTSCPAKNMP